MKKVFNFSKNTLICSALFVSMNAIASESRSERSVSEDQDIEVVQNISVSGDYTELDSEDSKSVQPLQGQTEFQKMNPHSKSATDLSHGPLTHEDKNVLAQMLAQIEQERSARVQSEQSSHSETDVAVNQNEIRSEDNVQQVVTSSEDVSHQSAMEDLVREQSSSSDSERIDQRVETQQVETQQVRESSQSDLSDPDSSYSGSSRSGINQIKKPLNKHAMSIVEYKIRKHKLTPLADSDFWAANRGKLPYSKCLITSIYGNWEQANEGAFVFGGSSKKMRGQNVFCYSKKHHTGFMIPVQVIKDKNIGASLTISDYRAFRATVKKLKGKKLSRLYGKYSGIQGGLGLFITASGAALGNNGVAMYVNTSLGGDLFDFSLAYRKLNLVPRKLYTSEIYSPAYLSKMNSAQRMVSLIQNNFSSQNNYYQEMMEQQYLKIQSIQSMSDSDKYNKMNRYWIHWLQDHASFDSLTKDVSNSQMTSLEFIKG